MNKNDYAISFISYYFYFKKLTVISKKPLIVNLLTMKTIKELKSNLMNEKSAHIFIQIKHQKKLLDVFAYQLFCLILFLG